ncbi:MAG: SAM-dependent methyltransferase [Gammaproteobacteria bacterium]|jgi:hypothetical protein
MAFELADVVPWGRTFAEYRAMFCLTDEDLRKALLGCGDGPASFNAEAARLGYRVLSTDPIYRFSPAQLRSRIDETAQTISRQLVENAHEFVWDRFAGPPALIEARMAAMRNFLEDYPRGLKEERYVDAELPDLPFVDRRFDLALCSHFLFLYSEQCDLTFHRDSISELCRVAREVRIFPLLELGSVRSRHLDAVVSYLKERGFRVEIVRVDYEFQKGGNEMLRVTPYNGASRGH